MLDTESFAGVEDGRALAQAIVDTIREPLLVLDQDLCVVAASRSFYLTFKLFRPDARGRPVYELNDGQWNIPELRLLLEKILPTHSVMEAYEVEQEFSGIGRRSMLLNARRVVFGERNVAPLILLAIEDITERRIVERKLAELMKEKETLLLEVPHRVSNSLQIIASILSLKAQTVQSEETRLHLQDAHRRVMSVAAVQRQLQATRHLERIEVGPYLTHLCQALAESMIGDSRPITLKVQADNGTATSNEAASIGLLVTELVINALKHAFVDGSTGGLIIVAYDVAGPDWKLTVSDNGAGQPEKAIAGLGTSIVEALSKQLEANVEISHALGGTTVSITHGSKAAHGAVVARLPTAA
jgi:two-component sensor histidine kinase